jgi:hypothetical protein
LPSFSEQAGAWSVYGVLFSEQQLVGSLWPYLLLAYAISTGPWASMANEDPDPASATAAFGTCFSAFVMFLLGGLKSSPELLLLLICLTPLLCSFLVQTALSFEMLRAGQKSDLHPSDATPSPRDDGMVRLEAAE